MSKYYVGDIGTDIIVDCGSAIGGATNLKLKIKKPDGTLVEWSAVIEGTDSLKYTTVSNDFDQCGVYYLQASLNMSGWTGVGETATFTIHSPYE
jgi:hypothetical protein